MVCFLLDASAVSMDSYPLECARNAHALHPHTAVFAVSLFVCLLEEPRPSRLNILQ